MQRFITLFIFVLYSATAAAATAGVSTYQLANGLRLIVQEDHRVPLVVSQVWYKIGSGYEPSGITGISHVLEHMMFQGTVKHPAGEFAKIIADNGGEENAFTDRDYTAYFQELPADKLSSAFELEADRMRNLTLDPAAFNKELQVVMEERRMRVDDNPTAMTYERFIAQAYVSSAYHHLPIGWMNDIKQLTVADVRAWYNQWYRPNNAIVVVAGDVKPEAVYQLARYYFGSLAMTPLPAIKLQAELPALGLRSAIVKLPAGEPWLVMGYSVPSLVSAPNNSDPYVLTVIQGILSGGQNNRFTSQLVHAQHVVADASADYNLTSRLSSLFTLAATPATGRNLGQVKAAVLAEIHKLQQQPVSAQELAHVKAEVIAGQVYGRDSMEDQATEMGSLEAVGLPWQLRDTLLEHITAVTAQQIQAVAQRYFSEDNLTLAELHALPLPKDAAGNTIAPSTTLETGHVR